MPISLTPLSMGVLYYKPFICNGLWIPHVIQFYTTFIQVFTLDGHVLGTHQWADLYLYAYALICCLCYTISYKYTKKGAY